MTSEHKKADIIFYQYQKRIFKILLGNKRDLNQLPLKIREKLFLTNFGGVVLRPWGIKTEN